MAEVWLHVYDIGSVKFNRFFKDRIGVGGIFHGAIQVYEYEWSFGCVDSGSGVFFCEPKENDVPGYAYRESLLLGTTDLSKEAVEEILDRLGKEWPGQSYGLLSRNCCHFCFELAKQLGVPEPPVWLNRFANIGEAIRNGVRWGFTSTRSLVDFLRSTAREGLELVASLHRHISAELGSHARWSVVPASAPEAPSDNVQEMEVISLSLRGQHENT